MRLSLIVITFALLPIACTSRPKAVAHEPRRISNNEFTAASINFWKAGGGARRPVDHYVGAKVAIDSVAEFIQHFGSRNRIIGFQEINENAPRDFMTFDENDQFTIYDGVRWDQPEQIANRLGDDWSHVFGAVHETGHFGTGGNAIVTNLPFDEEGWVKFIHDPYDLDTWGNYRRGMTFARFGVPGRSVWVIVTHLGGDPDDGHVAVRQLEQLLDHVDEASLGPPVIVMGDFNIRDDVQVDAHGAMDKLMARAGYEEICNSRRDYIFLHDPQDRLEITGRGSVEAVTGSVRFSDHEIVWCRLRWRD